MFDKQQMDFGDYGHPEYAVSQRFHQLIRYRLKASPGHSYLFSKLKPAKKRGDNIKSYWRCLECRRLREQSGCPGQQSVLHLVHLAGNVETIVTDPESGHHRNCVPFSDSKVEASELYQQAKLDLTRGLRKRPLEAYRTLYEKVTQMQNDTEQVGIETHLPPYKKIRRTLSRWSAKSIADASDPSDYSKTLHVRSAEEIKQTNDVRLSARSKSFLSFPNDPLLRDQWCKAIGTSNVREYKKPFICSRHFHPNCINQNFGRFTLLPGSVPSIFATDEVDVNSNSDDMDENDVKIHDCEKDSSVHLCEMSRIVDNVATKSSTHGAINTMDTGISDNTRRELSPNMVQDSDTSSNEHSKISTDNSILEKVLPCKRKMRVGDFESTDMKFPDQATNFYKSASRDIRKKNKRLEDKVQELASQQQLCEEKCVSTETAASPLEVKIISVESLASSEDTKPISPREVIIPSAESSSNSDNQHFMHPQKDLDELPPQDAAEKENYPIPRTSKIQMSAGNPESKRDLSPKEYRIQMVKRTDEPQSSKKEDECDAFAAYVAAKMRTMSREQRLYAEHYMFQVLYKGAMNQLPPPGMVTEQQYPSMMPVTFVPPEMYSHGQGRPGNGTPGYYYNTPVMPHRNMQKQ